MQRQKKMIFLVITEETASYGGAAKCVKGHTQHRSKNKKNHQHTSGPLKSAAGSCRKRIFGPCARGAGPGLVLP